MCTQRYVHRSLNGAEDRQKTGVLCMCVRFPCTVLGICSRASDLDATLLALITEWHLRQAQNRCVVHVCPISQHHFRDLDAAKRPPWHPLYDGGETPDREVP